MSAHTPTPWEWLIHDHSMASLGVMPDPGLGNPLVLCVSPCQPCMDRAEPREWKWGRCHTPSEADADFIVLAVNNHDALTTEVERLRTALRSASTQCGNVIYNCDQRPADNARHLDSWRSVKEFIDTALSADAPVNAPVATGQEP